MEFTDEEYIKERSNALELYNKLAPVKCPALGGRTVVFAAEGFNHILFKGKNRSRNKQDQFMRFKILHLVRPLLGRTTTYQEVGEKIQGVVVKIKKHKTRASKLVKYWGVIAITDRKRIRVIIRKVGEGNLEFWSVIPSWDITKHGEIQFRTFYSGNLEED